MFSTRKRCLIGIPIRGYQNFYSLPPKNWILGPKTAKFGPKLAFWAKYRHFWPIWSKAWPKNNADKLSRWFLLCCYQNFYLLPQKLGFFAQKRPNLAQNWHLWPNVDIFGPLELMADQKRTRCLGGFPLSGYQNFCFLPYKLGFLTPKRPNFSQNMHFWSFWATYCHFSQILSNARPKTNVNKVPRRVFRDVGNKTFDFSRKN